MARENNDLDTVRCALNTIASLAGELVQLQTNIYNEIITAKQRLLDIEIDRLKEANAKKQS